MALTMGEVTVSLPVVSVELWDKRGKAFVALRLRTTSLVVAVHYMSDISSLLTRY